MRAIGLFVVGLSGSAQQIITQIYKRSDTPTLVTPTVFG